MRYVLDFPLTGTDLLYTGTVNTDNQPHTDAEDGFLYRQSDRHPVYLGKFAEGKYHGQGTLYRQRKPVADVPEAEYDGEWKEGDRSGFGTSYYKRGCNPKYVGYWEDGMYHGKGRTFHPNGKTYLQGTFECGYIEGQARIYTDQGALMYSGEVTKSKIKHGFGTSYFVSDNFTDVPQTRYKGFYQSGLRHGFGTEYDLSGNVTRCGIWERGSFIEPVEEVTLFDKDGIRSYKGSSLNGNKCGQGTSYHSNGIPRYKGDYYKGKRHGYGIEFTPNGEILRNGKWEMDIACDSPNTCIPHHFAQGVKWRPTLSCEFTTAV